MWYFERGGEFVVAGPSYGVPGPGTVWFGSEELEGGEVGSVILGGG